MRTSPIAFVAALELMGGCVAPNGAPSASSTTRIDQLTRFYPELQGGRFGVIADFEDPAQMEIFRLASSAAQSKMALDKKHGRAETGPASLALTPGAKDDALVIANGDAPAAGSQHWYLKRDWRPYNLLMISVFSPVPSATLDVSIATGPIATRQSLHTESTLNRGWNLLRLDLSELGERLPIDDVQEIRIRVEVAGKPQTFYLDDLLLVDSQTPLLGDAKGPVGALYATQIGRRTVIGASGRFEITFAHGQIVEWFNLASDPSRLDNLVQGTSLGPHPISPAGESKEQGATSAGAPVTARQRIVELNKVRAVVESELWDETTSRLGRRSRWTYTIYPTGQIFVAFLFEPIDEAPNGIFVALSAPRTEDVEITPPVDSRSASDAARSWLIARIRPADTALLLVPSARSGEFVVESSAEPELRRVALRVRPAKPGDRFASWKGQLLLATSSGLSDLEAQNRAADYQHSVPLRFEVGKPAREFTDSNRTDGLDSGSGCFTVDAESGRARLVIDGSSRPLSNPVFRIRQARSESAWVYVNHLILDRVARTPDGDVVFQIQCGINAPTEIEVLTRGPLTVPSR